MPYQRMPNESYLLADYLAATGNEIEIDNNFFAISGVHPDIVGYIPRYPKWMRWSKRSSFLTRTLWRIARIVWILGGCNIFFLFQLLYAYLKVINEKCQIDEIATNLDCNLALSKRAGDVLLAGYVNDLSNWWITVPWVTCKFPANAKCLSIFSFVTTIDLIKSYCHAVLATHVLFKRRRTSKWVLQSYTAFYWFVVRVAIDNLKGSFTMSEHFDRWAVLVDSSVRNRKRRFNVHRTPRKLRLVQHGFLGDLSTQNLNSTFQLKLYRRLGSVTTLYAYNSTAEQRFTQHILSRRCVKRGIEVAYFQPRIDLRRLSDGSETEILFVGHPLCEVIHEYILNSICRDHVFKAYYKQHPLAPMSKRMKSLCWQIIEDPATFPQVSFVISYPSTVVVEYEALGIPVIVHPINLASDFAEKHIMSIISKLIQLEKNS